jgi:multiple sugar transport system substrate-binding protein
LVLNSKETIEVVRYVKDLYQGPIDKVFIFRGQDYHRDSMVSGKLSLTFETNIVSRTAEKRVPEMSSKIQLAKSPAGPVRRLGSNQMATYLIWKFSENIEGAKKFLVDYVGNFQEAFLASGFLYFPCHPKSVPDMERLLKDDPRGHPSTKYRVLEDVAEWTTNLGYPGYANAAMAEIFDSGVVSKMFRNFVAEYVPTAEKAVEQAEEDCKRIFTRWREKGLV